MGHPSLKPSFTSMHFLYSILLVSEGLKESSIFNKQHNSHNLRYYYIHRSGGYYGFGLSTPPPPPQCGEIFHCYRSTAYSFLTPAPKAGVIVVASAVRAASAAVAAGINLVGVPQTKPMQRFPPNF